MISYLSKLIFTLKSKLNSQNIHLSFLSTVQKLTSQMMIIDFLDAVYLKYYYIIRQTYSILNSTYFILTYIGKNGEKFGPRNSHWMTFYKNG